MSCKFINVHQALSYLEGLCQSEDAEDGSGSSIFSANVCIQLPDDVQGESDKDSGDEETPQFSNLGCRQLLAAATLEVHDETGRRVVGANNQRRSSRPPTSQLGGGRPTLGAQVSLKLLFGYVTIFSSADLFTTDLNCRKKLACDIISECNVILSRRIYNISIDFLVES